MVKLSMRIRVIVMFLVSVGMLFLVLMTSTNNKALHIVPSDISFREATTSVISLTTVSNRYESYLPHITRPQTSERYNMEQMFFSSFSKGTTLTHAEPSALRASAGQQRMAWIYPYKPACFASREYADGRKIDILKPEFFTINGGSLVLLDDTVVHCNGYSPSFVAELKQYSTSQFVTVSSASAEDMRKFLKGALNTDGVITALVTFVVENSLTGIEINFEDFGSWSDENYVAFKTFLTHLGNALHKQSKQLMVVGPPIASSTEEAWYVWRYEDFTTLPIDSMVVMGYDYQFDHGAGEPIAPLVWLKNVIVWVSARYPKEKLTIALPSYGYEGTFGTQKITILTYEQIRSRPGFTSAVRDPNSAEMNWRQGDSVYFYQDSVSLEQKERLVTSLGIHSLSVWHLGGNLWFDE